MFGKVNLRKIILRDDLEKLKKALENDPGLLEKQIDIYYFSGSLLHAAAHFSRSDIVRFLVTEKGVDVNSQLCDEKNTPLHCAAQAGDRAMAGMLIELGADPSRENESYMIPVDCASGPDFRAFLERLIQQNGLQSAPLNESLQQESGAPACQPAPGDDWSSDAAEEVTHIHDLGAAGLRIVDTFNFATKTWRVITKDLDSGRFTAENKTLDAATPEQVAEARAELDKLNSTEEPAVESTAEDAAPAEEPTEEKPAVPPRPKISFGSPS